MRSSYIAAWLMLRLVAEQAAATTLHEYARLLMEEPRDYCTYERRRTLEDIRDAEETANPHGFRRAFRFEYQYV